MLKDVEDRVRKSNTGPLLMIIPIVNNSILEGAGNTIYDREILKAIREKS